MLSFLLGLALVGCRESSHDRFTPSPTVAQNSLVMALDAWQAGETKTTLDGQSPAVQVADSIRRDDQKLARYRVVSELPSNDGRRFQVELQFENQSTVEQVQYVVVGIDPIWVMRQEDFDMVTHWDHPMPQKTESDESEGDESQTQDDPVAINE